MTLCAPPVSLRARPAQRGFTLIELMVSLTIGLIVMVALIAVYLNVSRTNSELARTNSMVESGRFSMDLLNEDIEHAGFWGGYIPPWDDSTTVLTSMPSEPTQGTAPSIVPDPCLAYSSWAGTAGYKNSVIGIPIQTYSGIPSTCTGLISNKQANTDVLVVRRAESCLPGVGNCEADTTTKVYFQSARCTTEVQAGNLYVLSATSTAFTLHNKDCTTVADRRKYVSDIYWVRTYSQTSGDGIPTLMRSTFDISSGTPQQLASQPLIEGVEAFIVDLGIDNVSRCATGTVNYASTPVKWKPSTCAVSATSTENTMPSNRGDGVPDSYVHCGATGCTVAQYMDVVAVKIWLLARTVDTSGAQVTSGETHSYTLGGASPVTITPSSSDKYRRHLFQSTIRLNNVSGRRESP